MVRFLGRFDRVLAAFLVLWALMVLASISSVLGPLGVAPARADTQRTANFMIRYDVDSGTETFCRVTGQNGDPFGGSIGVGPQIKTTGSSTSVTENVASTAPFAGFANGDIILVTRSLTTGVTDIRVVTDASGAPTTVVVDTAVDWSGGFTFRYLKTRCGTTDADGWVEAAGAKWISMTVQYEQGDLDNLSVRWYGRAAGIGSLPVEIHPGTAGSCGSGTLAARFCDFSTPGQASRTTYVTETPWNVVRMGFKRKTTDTSDAGANLEIVTATVTTSR